MENLKKVISLSQASKFSGYHSDYLSALIRKGELRGEKRGGNWFTTEDEINNYIFKQKIRHKKLAIGGFLSKKRTNKIILTSGMIFLAALALGIYIYGKNTKVILEESKKSLSPDVEVIQ